MQGEGVSCLFKYSSFFSIHTEDHMFCLTQILCKTAYAKHQQQYFLYASITVRWISSLNLFGPVTSHSSICSKIHVFIADGHRHNFNANNIIVSSHNLCVFSKSIHYVLP